MTGDEITGMKTGNHLLLFCRGLQLGKDVAPQRLERAEIGKLSSVTVRARPNFRILLVRDHHRHKHRLEAVPIYPDLTKHHNPKHMIQLIILFLVKVVSNNS